MLNVFTIIILNMIYFNSNYYPKHIIEVSGAFLPYVIVFNVLYYALFTFVLYVVITRNKHLFSERIFPACDKPYLPDMLKKFAFVVLIQIAFDIITMMLQALVGTYIIYIKDLMSILFWVVVYSIFTTKDKNIFQKKPVIVLAFLFAALVLTSYISYTMIAEYSFLLEKYDYTSDKLAVTIDNLDVMFGIKNFVLDTVVGVVLVLLHHLKKKEDDNEKENEEQEGRQRVVSMAVLRIIVLVGVAWAVLAMKIILLPCCIVKEIHWPGSRSTSYEKDFDVSSRAVVVTEFDKNGDEIEKYKKTTNKIYYDGKLLCKYSINGKKNSTLLKEYVSEGVTYSVHQNAVICFLDAGKPKAIHKDKKSIAYNEKLVKIYKDLIKQNNWEFFEQATNYLLKYDEEFIMPYLTLYADGNFTDDMLASMTEMSVREEYIESYAENMLQGKKSG